MHETPRLPDVFALPTAEELTARLQRLRDATPTAEEAGANLLRFFEAFNRQYPGGLIDAWGAEIARRHRA